VNNKTILSVGSVELESVISSESIPATITKDEVIKGQLNELIAKLSKKLGTDASDFRKIDESDLDFLDRLKQMFQNIVGKSKVLPIEKSIEVATVVDEFKTSISDLDKGEMMKLYGKFFSKKESASVLFAKCDVQILNCNEWIKNLEGFKAELQTKAQEEEAKRVIAEVKLKEAQMKEIKDNFIDTVETKEDIADTIAKLQAKLNGLQK